MNHLTATGNNNSTALAASSYQSQPQQQQLAPDDVDTAWSLQYVSTKGFTNGTSTSQTNTLLDRFLFAQEKNFSFQQENKDVTTERKRFVEWKATRKCQVEPTRGSYRDTKWRWLLIKSYVMEKDFISGYIPKRVDKGSKKLHHVVKKYGVKPPLPPAIPLPEGATLEESLQDLVEYKQELSEYLSTEWQPPVEKVSKQKISRQALSQQRRQQLLGSLAEHLPNLVESDVDILHSALHGSHIMFDEKKERKLLEQQQLQQQRKSALMASVSPSPTRGNGHDSPTKDDEGRPTSAYGSFVGGGTGSGSTLTAADLGSTMGSPSKKSSSSNQTMNITSPANARKRGDPTEPLLRKKLEEIKRTRPMIDEELRREIEFAAECFADGDHLEQDDRECLHGRDKIERAKHYGMRVREGIYTTKPILRLKQHASQRAVEAQKEMYAKQEKEFREQSKKKAKTRSISSSDAKKKAPANGSSGTGSKKISHRGSTATDAQHQLNRSPSSVSAKSNRVSSFRKAPQHQFIPSDSDGYSSGDVSPTHRNKNGGSDSELDQAARSRTHRGGLPPPGSLVVDYSFTSMASLEELLSDDPRNKNDHRKALALAAKKRAEEKRLEEERKILEEAARSARLHQFQDHTLIFNANDFNSIVARGETYVFKEHNKSAFDDDDEDGDGKSDLLTSLKKKALDADQLQQQMDEIERIENSGAQMTGGELQERYYSEFNLHFAKLYAHPHLGPLLRNEDDKLEEEEQQHHHHHRHREERIRYDCEVLKLNDNELTNNYPEGNNSSSTGNNASHGGVGSSTTSSSTHVPDLFTYFPLILSQRISNLSHITCVDLSNNALKVFPVQVIELPSLHSLFLHGNNIATFNSIFEAVGMSTSFVVVGETQQHNFVGLVHDKELPPSQRHKNRQPQLGASPTAKVRVGQSQRQFKQTDRSVKIPSYSPSTISSTQLRLTNLTLHGNPLNKTQRHVYKQNALFAFPFLSKLDFCDLLDDDREECFTAKQYKQLSKVREEFFCSAANQESNYSLADVNLNLSEDRSGTGTPPPHTTTAKGTPAKGQSPSTTPASQPLATGSGGLRSSAQSIAASTPGSVSKRGSTKTISSPAVPKRATTPSASLVGARPASSVSQRKKVVSVTGPKPLSPIPLKQQSGGKPVVGGVSRRRPGSALN